MSSHKTGTREQWLAARNELLAKEKELTRRGDQFATERRDLPWVPIDKEYGFDTDQAQRRCGNCLPERRSHDYVRHGTVDLFAALNTATGKVIGKLSAQHRAAGFRDFPGETGRQAEPGLAVHVICDNLTAHKAPVVHRWLLAHSRFQLHFTPAYSSWINQAGRWLAELERRCLDRGLFCSLDELKTALENRIKTWNKDARPFQWTKTADQIIDRICRYCRRISEPAHSTRTPHSSAS